MYSTVNIEYYIIRDIKITTASVHDSRVDLSKKEEIAYRDKGIYSGTTPNRYSATMKKGARNHHPIEIKDKKMTKIYVISTKIYNIF